MEPQALPDLDWLDDIPEGPPWTANDPDPLVRMAVQLGFTTARPTTSPSSEHRLQSFCGLGATLAGPRRR
jgi:hypothetical protein